MTDKKSEVRQTRRWRKSFKMKCKSARFKPVDFSIKNKLFGASDARMNTTDPHKLLQHTRASVIKHSLYSSLYMML